jgi:hypothetical protein
VTHAVAPSTRRDQISPHDGRRFCRRPPARVRRQFERLFRQRSNESTLQSISPDCPRPIGPRSNNSAPLLFPSVTVFQTGSATPSRLCGTGRRKRHTCTRWKALAKRQDPSHGTFVLVHDAVTESGTRSFRTSLGLRWKPVSGAPGACSDQFSTRFEQSGELLLSAHERVHNDRQTVAKPDDGP